MRRLWLPHWAAALLTLVLPAAAAARKHRIRRRITSGRCAACGYDLRATPDKGGTLLTRCPECGAVPVRKGAT